MADEEYEYDEGYDEGDLEVTAAFEDEEEKLEPFVYDEDALNLVDAFEEHPDGEMALKELAMQVIDDFEADWSSTEEYRSRMADDWALFAGHMPDKSFPYENCANGNIPLFMENTLRLSARIGSEVFGDWTAPVGVVPVGPDDEGIAEAMSMHDNWQFREDIPDFSRQQERLLLSFLVAGDVTSHSYYDMNRRQNRHEALTPDEFVAPYVLTSTFPDYSDMPHYTKILRRYRHELQRMRGAWSNVDDVLEKATPSWDTDPEAEIADELAEVTGVEASDESNDGSTPYKLLQYEGWTRHMPGQEEDRFVQVIMCPDTLTILKLCIYEEVHWKDRVEERERRAELSQYKRDVEMVATERRAMADRDFQRMTSDLENGTSLEEQEMREAVEGPPTIHIPDPVAPDWIDDPANPPEYPPSPKRVPIRMFGHGVNIEPPMGGLGLGYGRIQGDLARATNTVVNQFVDQATMHNSPPTLVSFELPNDFEWAPGTSFKVESPTEDIAKSIYTMPSQPANPQLLEWAKMMMSAAQSSVQAPDVLSGAPGKSGETYRGIASRIEQATKQLGVTARKFAHGVLRQQIVNNAKLNAKFLPESQMLRVLDSGRGRFVDVQIDRSMYERDYRVEFRADLRFTSETQKMQEAQEMMTLAATNPALASNMAFMYKAVKQFLEASNRQDMVDSLGAAPPAPAVFGAPAGPPPMPVPGGPAPQGAASPGGGDQTPGG